MTGELAHTELHGKVNVAVLHNFFFFTPEGAWAVNRILQHLLPQLLG